MKHTLMIFGLFAALLLPVAAQTPNFNKLMITEVSWGEPDGVELTNFATTAIDTTGWTIHWNDGSLKTSSPLNVTIQPGESIIVKEPIGAVPEAPPGTVVLPYLPPLTTGTQAFSVALKTQFNFTWDEVRISSGIGTGTPPSLGGVWRGLAQRGIFSSGVERIWGLDSDAGRDWTQQSQRSFGLENRSSGARGTDTLTVPSMKINEVSIGPDYIELVNNGPFILNLTDWFLLISPAQGFNPWKFEPWPAPFLFNVQTGGYVVIGESSVPPAELPGGVPYVNVGSVIPFFDAELAIGLYDDYGRLVDMVCTTGADDDVVHNLPRLPSHWTAFEGAAGREANGGASGFGRTLSGPDTDTGADFLPMYTRSMGSSNVAFSGAPGHPGGLDVRLNGTAVGAGMTLILNGGGARAGARYSFLYSIGHLQGEGPFFGLGSDALMNWLLILNSPLAGTLGSDGSARLDLPTGSLPPGLDVDTMFVLEQPIGVITYLSPIIEFDT